MIKRVLHAVLAGLAGAGLVHVAIALLLPEMSARATWMRLAAALPEARAVEADASVLPMDAGDPFFLTGLCRVDLRDGPLHVTAQGRSAAWSVAVYAADGTVLSSLDDRMVPGGALNLLVLPPDRMAGKTAGGDRAEAENLFYVEVEAGEVLLALRVFAPDPSWRDLARNFLASLSCTPAPDA